MKNPRIFAFVLAIILLSSAPLTACGNSLTAENQVTSTKKTETKTETAETDGTKTLENPLKKEDLEALPISSDEMTYNERRQLAIDYFQLQLSFHWIPNVEISDYFKTYGIGKKTISTRKVYGGIPYQTKGVGNLYRWMEYYDEETGVMDLARAIEENGGYGEDGAAIDEKIVGGQTYRRYRSLMTLFNQCSAGSCWGWTRVINSADFISTTHMNLLHGFIPVGYTYPNMDKIDAFGVQGDSNPSGYDTPDVIRDWNAAHGEDAMFLCYAKTRPADLLVNTGHTMMIKEVQLKNLPDGTVDWENSVLICMEQVDAWRTEQKLSDGTPLVYQGETACAYTFQALQKQNYIPFTFAEFLDPEDKDDRTLLNLYRLYAKKNSPLASCYKTFSFTANQLNEMCGETVEKVQLFTNLPEKNDSITFAQLEEMKIASNYSISDVFVTVKNPQGTVLVKNVYRSFSATQREMGMKEKNSTYKKDAEGKDLTMTAGISEYATGENTVEISMQLSNGEKPVVFSGILLP